MTLSETPPVASRSYGHIKCACVKSAYYLQGKYLCSRTRATAHRPSNPSIVSRGVGMQLLRAGGAGSQHAANMHAQGAAESSMRRLQRQQAPRQVKVHASRQIQQQQSIWNCMAAALAALSLSATPPALASQRSISPMMETAQPVQQQEQQAVKVDSSTEENKRSGKEKRKRVYSNLPDAASLQAMSQRKQTMFLEDAWEGMLRLQPYAEFLAYLEEQGLEEAPGCEQCTDNRLILEQAWQVVANEFYDPLDHFSQKDWADRLLPALKGSPGGVLRSKQELYAAGKAMLASLGDPYTELLEPAEFRKAVRRPLPRERAYYAAQYVGLGLQVGGVPQSGHGRLVEAALAGSPAEEAGVRRGDVLLTMDDLPVESLTDAEISGLQRGPVGSAITIQWLHHANSMEAFPSSTTSSSSSSSRGSSRGSSEGSSSGSMDKKLVASLMKADATAPGMPLSQPQEAVLQAGQVLYEKRLERRSLPSPPLRTATLAAVADAGSALHLGLATQVPNDDKAASGTPLEGRSKLVHGYLGRAAVGGSGGGLDPTGNSSSSSGSSGRTAASEAVKEETSSLVRQPQDEQQRPKDGKVQYLRVFYFSSDASASVREAVTVAENDPGVAGLVVDLRNNPGGVFEEGVHMATFFLDPGQLVVETARNKDIIDGVWRVGDLSPEVFPTVPSAALTHKPVILLVNSSTASAAEVFAGALHDNGRALIIGTTTFGKGRVQYYFPVGKGDGGVKVTIAKFLTPNGYDISLSGGLAPDIACDDFPRPDPADCMDACLAEALRLIHL